MSRTTSLLSQRESQIVSLISGGERLIDVARKLHLKQSTVATYKKRILEKVNVANVVQLNEWYRNKKNLPEYTADTSFKIAERAFTELFDEGFLYMLYNVRKNPKTWRRLILEKFANEVDFDDNKSELLSRVLLWINEENKKHVQ